MSVPLLEARRLCVRFGAVEAVRSVSLTLSAGEVLAVVGDNGAGKSTLFRVLNGTLRPDSGDVLVAGKPAALRSPADARRLGLETVHQDLALCDNLDVTANLFLGREVTRHRLLDEPAMEERARTALQRLRVELPGVRVSVASLSGGQRQCVAVARALLWEPRVVLLDEPTAALGVTQAAEVLDVVRQLRTAGMGVMVISHNLADVFRVADRILVMRLGAVAAVHDVRTVDAPRVVADITGAVHA